MGEPVLLQVPHDRSMTQQDFAQIKDAADNEAVLRWNRGVHYRAATGQGTWMEVLSDVGDADDEVKHEARAFLVGLGYKTPRSAMMADIELDFPEPGAWPGGKVHALIWEVLQHLAGLQAVADSNAASQASSPPLGR